MSKISKKDHYIELDISEVRKQVDDLTALWVDFLRDNCSEDLIINCDYFIHEINLYEVIKRTDKRKVYYQVFHKINYDSVCEYKEIAILAYWIITLKPFMVTRADSKVYSAPNEMFALYIIMGVLSAVYRRFNHGENIPPLAQSKIKDYIYYLKYCDVSRESLIQFVDMLASIYGIGTDVVFDENM